MMTKTTTLSLAVAVAACMFAMATAAPLHGLPLNGGEARIVRRQASGSSDAVLLGNIASGLDRLYNIAVSFCS